MKEAESRNYYYSNEAAKRLGIPEIDMWRMKSIQILSDGKQTFPKRTIDSMANSWSSVLCKQYLEATKKPGDQFNTINQQAEALLKENSRLRAKNTEARQSAAIYKSQLDKKSRECTRLASDLDSLRKLIEYLKNENQALKTRVDAYEPIADSASASGESGEKKSLRERLSRIFRS